MDDLTQEQILQLRSKYGFDQPTSNTPAPTSSGKTAADRFKELGWDAPAAPTAPEHFKAGGALGAIQDVAHGAAKAGTQTLLDIGHLGQKIQGGIGTAIDTGVHALGGESNFAGDANQGVFAPQSAQGQAVRADLEPTNTGETIGKYLEKGAEMAVPIGGAPATTVLGKAAQGAVIGGGLSGAQAIADDKSAGEVVVDTGIGAVAGGALGTVGGVVGKLAHNLTPEEKLKFVIPTSREIPEGEYRNLVKQGRIAPRTLTKPAEYIMSPSEKATALKYHDVIDRNPVNTTINIGKKIGDLDNQVGDFLRTNNGIFNQGELKNHLNEALSELDDITVPEERVQKAKETLINRFVNSIDKNDMEGLWKARKDFDQSIDTAFKGSPTLQKEVKIKLRNAVQDFIADRTPDGAYRSYMRDMSNLFDLQDVATVKAAKGRGLDELRQWAKDNPRTAKVLGIIGIGGLGALGVGAVTNVAHAGSGE